MPSKSVTETNGAHFLPERSQLWLLLAAVAGIIAVVSFANLAVARSAAQAELDIAKTRLQVEEERHSELNDALERAQRGEHVVPKAIDYFDVAPEGVTVYVPEPDPVQPVATPERPRTQPPYWVEWWKLLVQP